MFYEKNSVYVRNTNAELPYPQGRIHQKINESQTRRHREVDLCKSIWNKPAGFIISTTSERVFLPGSLDYSITDSAGLTLIEFWSLEKVLEKLKAAQKLIYCSHSGRKPDFTQAAGNPNERRHTIFRVQYIVFVLKVYLQYYSL